MSRPSDPPARPSLVSVSKYLPFEGIRHAGGQYALQHYRALRDMFTIHVVAPSTRLNRDASATEPDLDYRLLQSRSLLSTDAGKPLADLQSVVTGSSAHPWFRRALANDAPSRVVLSAADIVEYQWSEMSSLTRTVRRLAPGAKTVIIAHDVITQRWDRAAEQATNPLKKMAFSAAARASRRRERRSFDDVDAVITFSEKDAALVRELSPSSAPVVVHPGFPVPPARQRGRRNTTVVFTGAMNRPDNDEAARWFLSAVWPRVSETLPDARFRIVGANPSAALRAAASRSDRVEVTGAVDSFDDVYSDADVCVVPLLNGAGVKFKTIDAMMWGIPAVTTSVGAEGIEGADLLHAVVDDPDAFADAVISALRGAGEDTAIAARAWAVSVYGLDAFRDRLRGVYAALLDAQPQGDVSRSR
ncbi:glycosyltransferase [Microbacterium oxydans]|uniref:glycosyltransferase n=1 Tax=Microbacterium oxydans TaxID=82380 RepID=UPI0037C649A0